MTPMATSNWSPLSWMTFRLRWAAGPGRDTDVLVSATRTDFERFRDMPGAIMAALRLRRAIRTAPGAVGVSLAMRPTQRRGWSVSAWEAEADLHRFLQSPAHQVTARRFRSCVTVRGESWRVERFDLADAWRQASVRLGPLHSGWSWSSRASER
jgi:heme-degrading monooxygenase HmoA